MKGNPRILIIRLSAIGDVVRALPVLHVLHEAFPDAQIDWVVERKAAAVVEGHPCLNHLLVFERPAEKWKAVREFFSLCREIRSTHYDIVLDLHGILKTGLILGASGARKRVGFAWPRAQEGSHLFANKRVRLGSKRLNRVEENLALCGAVAPQVGWPSVSIFVSEEVRNYVDAFFEETFDGGKSVVVMHAPVDRPEKQWPLENFAALADLLLADGRFEVLLTWGPGQFHVVERVLARARRAPIVAPETPDLKHLAWLLHQADLYFGGDTGPMHIASAMDTPVVAVFGGTDPAKHAPYRPFHRVLYHEAQGEQERLSADERLRHITPEMAYDACVGLLAEVRSRGPSMGTPREKDG